MAKGDHIYTQHLPHTHHGIDCGDDSVIHYGKRQGEKICRISKNDFASGNKIHVKEYGKCYSDDEVVRRAESRLDEKGYDLFSNNCEHFAYWCKTGKDKSEQVAQAQGGVAGLVGGVAIGTGTKVATKIATEAAIQSANPISKFLINVGLKQAPAVAGTAAAGIVNVGGIASGLVADFIVGKILEDDEALTESEREARKNGRIAGQVASTIGGVGGGIAAVTVGGSAAVAAAVAAPAVLGIAIGLGAYHLLKDE
ncbi:MAG: lecithin retinol acyltransferase family protein [Tychonema bourrellyi B0820]|uniref:NC domain protein n=1 Tax=Tychonema bourrellyi FEM_GT703 TaxID=2040638 RepID=A0A2G4F1Q1_9CYAN|nr:lecithin retinol acyltransferase family protein [Tychonema bourrellyi]MDQ2098331.1 lecithin retinol acyltransferase family protein [Tychonema bourrellyi B0820]PHX55690.1 NC domain protein [Tychonema bourrellyi FEM_GT703]TAD96032.1 MAG: NC domain protein [Oscillatoriales cyanobacterium]